MKKRRPTVAPGWISIPVSQRPMCETILASHRALIATLFCDIRGFTAFCETAEPEETIEVLQAYHEEMGTLISAHSAGVDKRMGDGIMVVFNDQLLPRSNHKLKNLLRDIRQKKPDLALEPGVSVYAQIKSVAVLPLIRKTDPSSRITRLQPPPENP